MKIALASHHFPPTYTAGAERYAFQVAREMIKRNHQVHVISVEKIDVGPKTGWFEDSIYEGIPVRRLFLDLLSSPYQGVWEYDNPWIKDQVRAWLQEFKPDLFHLVSGYLLSGSVIHAAKEAGLPVVVTLTDFWFLCPRITMLRSDGNLSTLPIDPATCARCRGEERKVYKVLGKYLPNLMESYWKYSPKKELIEGRMDFLQKSLALADAMIAPSHFLGEFYTQAGFSAERINFILYGRDFPHLTPELLDKTKHDRIRVGYLGQIARHKGVHVIIEALRQLPGMPFSLEVYGNLNHSPEYTEYLVNQAKGDDRIHLCGPYKSDEELSAIFQNMDVLVVPSLWYENSPFVILEAFGHRTPVITSKLGGMSEHILEGENGLLFTPGDASHLANQLMRLMNEPGLLERLQEGTKPIKSVAQEITDLEECYEKVFQK